MCPIEHFDVWFVHLIVRRLDPSTRKSWAILEENVQGFSTYADLLRFLEACINSLTPPTESSESSSKPTSKPHPTTTGKPQSKSNAEKQITSHVTQQQSTKPKQRAAGKGKSDFKCLFCPEAHGLFKCEKFLNLNTQERIKLVKSKKLWENCFSTKHATAHCSSSYRCRQGGCNEKHHTLLHREKPSVQSNTSLTKFSRHNHLMALQASALLPIKLFCLQQLVFMSKTSMGRV